MNSKLFFQVVHECKDVHGSALALLFLLCAYADDRGRSWLKPGTLAENAHLSKPQCRRLVAELRDTGYVVVEPPRAPAIQARCR